MQLGFVAGTLVSAIVNVSDVLAPRYVFAASALLAAIANAAFALASSGPGAGIALRFATGFFLAGVLSARHEDDGHLVPRRTRHDRDCERRGRWRSAQGRR